MASKGQALEKPAHFNFGIVPTKMQSSTAEKKYRQRTLGEILRIITALLNTEGGGRLELTYERNPPKDHVENVVKLIEQRLIELVGITTVTLSVKIEVANQKITVDVRSNGCQLWTVNYNLHLPMKTQVVAVPSYEPPENIRNIINGSASGNITLGEETTLSSYHQDFTYNNTVKDLEEGVQVQFKLLVSEPSKCTKLVDRMLKNRFLDYISAFANHLGGHIYYGINNSGVVKGQDFDGNTKLIIPKKVENALRLMVWPNPVEKGKQWDIFFVPVKDSPKHNTYVIVVGVARCPGGVFKEAPQSFFVNSQGKIEQMKVSLWKETLMSKGKERSEKPTVVANTKDLVPVLSNAITQPSQMSNVISLPNVSPCDVSRPNWSSLKNERIYHWFTLRLVEFRNNKHMKRFELVASTATKYPDSDAALVVISERVAVEYKKKNFDEAVRLLKVFEDMCSKQGVCDVVLFLVRATYLKSRIQKAKDNFGESYQLAQDGLQQLCNVPTSFLTPWFFIHAASVAILSGPNDPTKHEEALEYLKLAQASASSLECRLDDEKDLKQKLHIYKAEAYLGCSQSGDYLDIQYVSRARVRAAEVELNMVDPKQTTFFRKIQLYIAQADVAYRNAQLNETQEQQFLKQSLDLSQKAYDLACKHRFMELIHYANTRIEMVEHQLPVITPTDPVDDTYHLNLLDTQRAFIES